MKFTTLFLVFFSICYLNVEVSFAQESKSWLKEFFSPLPPPFPEAGVSSLPSVGNIPDNKWQFRPIVSLPALKITESSRSDAEADVFLLTSTGGGISIQRLKPIIGDNNNPTGKWKSTFSFSPITVLLSGNLSADDPVDLSLASTFGFFNNLVMVGGGYDLGSVGSRSRWFGLLSIGVNFNNS